MAIRNLRSRSCSAFSGAPARAYVRRVLWVHGARNFRATSAFYGRIRPIPNHKCHKRLLENPDVASWPLARMRRFMPDPPPARRKTVGVRLLVPALAVL